MEKYFEELGVGDPEDRVEAKLKVTGAAKFAAEYDMPDLLHGVLVTTHVANGAINEMNIRAAETAPGVKYVMTHLNRPQVPAWDDKQPDKDARVPGQEFRPFFDNRIYFSGQPIALVVADTLERAQYAASLVKATYNKQTPETDLNANLPKAVEPPQKKDANYGRGDVGAVSAATTIEQTYKLNPHIHNQMEPHAAIANWESAGKLMLYNKTQWIQGSVDAMTKAFKIKKEDVHVVSKFLGGAFGGASRVWPHEWSAVMAAKKLGKPVKVVLQRDDLFTMTGHRPEAIQKIKLSAAADGKLLAIEHDAFGHTSVYEQFAERIVDSTKMLYDCSNVKTSYRLVPLHVGTPTYTRAPGEATGMFALETALDELAVKLNIDPVDLRMKNYAATTDPEKKLPFSAKNLDECYRRGAESFGWKKRNSTPRAVEKNGWLFGTGMASAVYHSRRQPATIKAVLNADGTLLIQTAATDSGPGSYTVMKIVAAEAADYPADKITVQFGDSMYPPAPGQFGSMSTASLGTAVTETCRALVDRLKELAVAKGGDDFSGKKPEDIKAKGGELWPEGARSAKISFAALLKKAELPMLEITKESKAGPEQTKYSVYAYGASFVEVMVNKHTGQTKISRVTSVIDNGKVINKKTARNQVMGCVAWGIGMALMEEGVIDHRYGRYVNANLADYHISVNADVPETDVIFIDKPDYIIDPMGAKGLGEIPFVGFAAAVVNAVYNATGIRVRDLPVTPDKLI